MEKAKNTIVKAKIKDSQLEVVYDEIFQEENYSNTITKKCSQIVHADMRNAFDELRKHVVVVCEMPEVTDIKSKGFYNLKETDLNNYVVTGYSHGGSDDSAGVTIIAQKLLGTGKVLNLITPFIQFEDTETYEYAGDLAADIHACDCEVTEYLFNEKFGIKQLDFDFDTPNEVEITVTSTAEEKPKRKSRKKKELVSFDNYA